MQRLRYRADRFRLARLVRPCFSCGSASLGARIILPAGYLRTVRATTSSQTDVGREPVGLIYVARFNTLALDAMLRLTGPSYYYDRDAAAGVSYFASHCDICRVLFRDRPDPLGTDSSATELVDIHVPVVAVGPIEEFPLPLEP